MGVEKKATGDSKLNDSSVITPLSPRLEDNNNYTICQPLIECAYNKTILIY